jgi:hypothetical protein
MMPAIGYRFGGYKSLFFINPYISVPMGFGATRWHDNEKKAVIAHFRAGVGIGIAW